MPRLGTVGRVSIGIFLNITIQSTGSLLGSPASTIRHHYCCTCLSEVPHERIFNISASLTTAPHRNYTGTALTTPPAHRHIDHELDPCPFRWTIFRRTFLGTPASLMGQRTIPQNMAPLIAICLVNPLHARTMWDAIFRRTSTRVLMRQVTRLSLLMMLLGRSLSERYMSRKDQTSPRPPP